MLIMPLVKTLVYLRFNGFLPCVVYSIGSLPFKPYNPLSARCALRWSDTLHPPTGKRGSACVHFHTPYNFLFIHPIISLIPTKTVGK